jgi:hypothetical protein
MLDRVKIANVAIEHGGRRTVAMIAGVKLTPRANFSLHETQHVAVILTVPAPPADDHRSMAGDDVPRRRKGNGYEATLQGVIEQARDTVRCGSSPGGCRAWWRGRGWSESWKSASPGGGEDELDEEAPG